MCLAWGLICCLNLKFSKFKTDFLIFPPHHFILKFMLSPAMAPLSTTKPLKPKKLGVILDSFSFILYIYSLGNFCPLYFQNIFLIHLLFSVPTATLGHATVISHLNSCATLLIGLIPLLLPYHSLHNSQWSFNNINQILPLTCVAPSSHYTYTTETLYHTSGCTWSLYCLPSNFKAILPLIYSVPASLVFFVSWNLRAHSYLRTLAFLSPKSSQG